VPKRDHQLHGLLVIDKPGQPAANTLASPGVPVVAASHPTLQRSSSVSTRLPTSHDIVQMVRRWSGQRQIGHTGTLDPMASGVLVLCLGNATRLVEYYQGHPKQYYAEIVLGSATDTYDAIGEISTTAPIPALAIAQIEAALEQFRGDILQTPPVYSALKQGGESLHHKARRGEDVTVASRPVTFYQLDLLDYKAPDRICLRAFCSAGTYIRSLAYDLGIALQTVAHLGLLRREAAGQFTLAEARSLAEIENMAQQDRVEELLLPLGYGLELPSIQLDDAQVRRFGQGQKVILAGASINQAQIVGALAQGKDASDRCVGILRCVGAAIAADAGFVWKAEKWFASSND